VRTAHHCSADTVHFLQKPAESIMIFS